MHQGDCESKAPLAVRLRLQGITDHVIIGVANVALKTEEDKIKPVQFLVDVIITHLEYNHVVVCEVLTDVSEDDHVGPGALEAARGGEAKVVI